MAAAARAPSVGRVIDVHDLTKRYGGRAAVDGLSFSVRPGRVTGFLGPNGAGKSTTMRVILGLDPPDRGTALVGGRPYPDLREPLRVVGSLLDARGVHPGRTARHHLAGLAAEQRAARLPGARGAACRRAGRGGGQAAREGLLPRHGAAPGHRRRPARRPEVLILDEPVNGLDTEGIRWIRDLLRKLAAEGRTVFVSSHLMSEMELTADHLIVISRGRLLADAPVREFLAAHAGAGITLVRGPEAERLREVLRDAGGTVRPHAGGGWLVSGLDAARIGELAHGAGLAVHELTPRRSTLEEVYTAMTGDRAGGQAGGRAGGAAR